MSAESRETAEDGERPDIEKAVGHAVRAFRQERGISITDLASSAGVSVAMLSRVESGRVAASLRTLQAIATALRVPVASLLKDVEEKSDATFLPPGGGLEVVRQALRGTYIYRLLGHTTTTDVVLEPYINVFPSTDGSFKRTQYDGVKFLYMLEGEITYQHGDTIYTMTPGATLFFGAQIMHGPERILKAPATLLSVQAYLRNPKRNQNK
ncbi:XRE family transcriptional regulator [Aquibium sp. A9E412]|uniref:helix-turn-helix domain-containing protein n=1 Tax=Aquibium sp. A9E412 TaxID=2976767 RepID=UPI0025AEE90B|nr:XRE family transcriptional regulator [Aquibium sp. A9E412]MDN2567306.1 XRE family transcriptional regulator [Aquibium sp. A9E412]